ncbi:MAG: hypothetical protein DRJ05_19215 [Bacteroidetes bacterium]|nr:MAG: hypothetical protein DRJ05_19215 [Bacteroidota bacterium]
MPDKHRNPIRKCGVPKSCISILKNWDELAFMFYFGSRGLEKIVSRTPELTKKLFERSKRK